MADLENSVVEETQLPEQPEQSEQPEVPAEEKPSKGKQILAAVKEKCRKFIVSLKRKPQMIALVVILVSSLLYLCCLGTFSQALDKNNVSVGGICVFVNTLVSILILPTFLNAFPKRKKPRIAFIVVVFVLLALLIGLDVLLYMNTQSYVVKFGINLRRTPIVKQLYTDVIVHIVFVGISILAFAFLPLYKKGINKINTRKNLAENKLSEEIDTSAEV